MKGFKLIKTTFENNKEIIGVNFVGGEDYNSFVKEVRKTYNLPADCEVQVFTSDFIVRPEIFSDLVAQYISNLDFVLDIRLCDAPTCVSSLLEVSESVINLSPDPLLVTGIIGQNNNKDSNRTNDEQQLPSTQDIRMIHDIQDVLNVRVLENKHRTKIAKALISYLLNNEPARKLIREDFLQLAQSIVEIFPSEVKETYYVPFTKGHIAKGKLFDAYNNTKTRLRAAGLLRSRIKSESVPDDSADNSVASFTDSEPVIHFSPENTWFTQKECLQQKIDLRLPSTHDIKQIPEFEDALKLRTLENKSRTKIAKALISFVLSKEPDIKLMREDFLQLAQSIVDIFPTELRETYYVPSKSGVIAKGKLFDSYNNIRARFRAAGIIRRRIRPDLGEYFGTAENSNDYDNESAEDDIDERQMEILISGCAEWHEIVAMWRKSRTFRKNELQQMSTTCYIEKYKVLLHENSYELFNIDYHSLYPMSKSIYEWRLYYRQIIARAEKLKDKHIKEILTNIENAKDEDSKLALAFMLVPYISSYRKIPKLEIQESFICYCKNDIFADEESENGPSVKRLKIESPPKIYLIAGDHSTTVALAYVDMCGIRLKFDNPLKAIEVCFHCFAALNIRYPNNCSKIWMFVQKLVFEISTPWDTAIPSINTLINDLHSEIGKKENNK